jgi:hypothetical protein
MSGPDASPVRKLAIYPNELVPLQIDLAIEVGRYLFRRSANPGARVSGPGPGDDRHAMRAVVDVGVEDVDAGAVLEHTHLPARHAAPSEPLTRHVHRPTHRRG